MIWKFSYSDGWSCESAAKRGLVWRIVVNKDGEFHLRESDHGLTERKETFAAFKAAKGFCESSENAYEVFEVDSLLELRSKLQDEYEHAKACEDSMTLGTVGVVAAFGRGMREVLLSSQQRETVKSLVSQMFAGRSVPLSDQELPLEAKYG